MHAQSICHHCMHITFYPSVPVVAMTRNPSVPVVAKTNPSVPIVAMMNPSVPIVAMTKKSPLKLQSSHPYPSKLLNNANAVLTQLSNIFEKRWSQIEHRKELAAIKKREEAIAAEVKRNLMLGKLHKELMDGQDMIYVQQNSKQLRLTFIPVMTNKVTFAEWAETSGGLHDIITQLSSKQTFDETSEPVCAHHMCVYLAKTFPSSFRVAAKENGFSPTPPRMTAIQTAAIAKDVGIPEKPLFDVLGRHLSVWNSGNHVLCPRRAFADMTEDAPHPQISGGKIIKNDVAENFTSCLFDPLEQMLKGVKRMLQHNYADSDKKYNQLTTPMFGYRTSTNCKKGVFLIDGIDHGQNAL